MKRKTDVQFHNHNLEKKTLFGMCKKMDITAKLYLRPDNNRAMTLNLGQSSAQMRRGE